MHPVAIIGGGITGLTAAFRLNQRQIPVVLYEASARVGGPLQTLREKGYLSEYGPNTILETSPCISALISDLGLESRQLYADPRMKNNYLVRNGSLKALPTNPFSFLTSGLFSFPGKLCVIDEMLIPRNKSSEEESVAAFVRRRLGQEFLDYAINPFVTGIYAGDPEKLSVRHAFPKLLEIERTYGSLILGALRGSSRSKNSQEISKSRARKLSFDDGLEVLPKALHARLAHLIRLNAEVTGLGTNGKEWSLSVRSGSTEEWHYHSAIVLCSPSHQIARMKTDSISGLDFSLLGEIHYPPVARIVLGFKRQDVRHPLNGFGVLIPKCENLNILGTTFSSSLFPDRAPRGHVTLTTFIGGCRQPHLACEPEDKLFEYAYRDLQRLLKISGRPAYHHHYLYQRAIPQYTVGYGRYLDFMTDTEAKHPGLFFAGNYRDGISIVNSILSGEKAADRLTKTFKTKTDRA